MDIQDTYSGKTEAGNCIAAVYLALTAVSELFIKWLNRRANVGVAQGEG